MKEIEQKQEMVVKMNNQKEKKEKQFLGQLKPQKGHSVFSFNHETAKTEKIVFEPDTTLHLNGDLKKKNKSIIIDPNCFYLTALNIQNAKRKLRKLGFKLE